MIHEVKAGIHLRLGTIQKYYKRYNRVLNKLLQDGTIQFTNQYYLKRISKGKQALWKDVKDSQYGKPFIRGNGLVVALFEINPPATTLK